MLSTLPLRNIIILFCLAVGIPALGQDTPRAQHYLSIGHENDFLNAVGLRTDQYYTGGVFVQYGSYTRSGHGVASRILFAPGRPQRSFYQTSFSFLMYSPTNLRLHTAQVGDYPYSGTLRLGLSRETMPVPGTLVRAEIRLGITGPLAQGEWAQQTLHKSMHFIIPRGWANQLPDYPIINYNLYYEKNLVALTDYFHLNGLGYAQLGSETDAVTAGLNLNFSSNPHDYFPSRVYAANETENSKRWKFFAELRPTVRFVAYNSLIEGGLFRHNDSYHIAAGDVNRILFEGSGGIGIRSRGFSFSYKEIVETKEFRSVHYHAYGSVFVTVRL